MEFVLEKRCDTGDEISNEIIRCERFPIALENVLNNVIKKENYRTYKLTKRQISTDGGSYLGVLYEVDIKGKIDEDKDKEDNLFIKHIACESFAMLDVYDAYRRELFAYTDLSKVFIEIQDEAKVPFEERFKMAKGYSDSNSEVIILENMSKRGFTTYNRMEGVSLEFAELSIKQLAKFHGLSLVLKNKRPVYFERKLKTLKCIFNFKENWFNSFRNLCHIGIESLDCDDKIKALKFVDKTKEFFKQCCTDTTSVGCCICHGDYRTNNILVKELNGVSVEVMPVDFQMLYYGCPMNDFLYFIFTGTDQPFRAQHLDHLKNLYHETLGHFLKYFNLDVENIYPRKEFETQYKEKLDYALLYALFEMSFLFAEGNDILDLSQDLGTLSVKMNKKADERVKGLIEDFKNWGVL